ncbi:hypothetical protein ACFSC6_10405 [Rufibacter sediminis]|uniref:Uncharacterized protein n=1 Tax=Rufibacter sediminis TaxID=2762756 RepID=A0ABR6VP79_9BACT|nr:hypothetical protein [Rufibacter sediminis]MBC3538945.1 hypothetical protein [Rufibacter sediminis]
MRRNENQFLLLDLLLQEAKEYHLKEADTQAGLVLLDQTRKAISLIEYDEHRKGISPLVLGALESLSAAEGLAHQGHVAAAFTSLKLALMNLLAKKALFQQP